MLRDVEYFKTKIGAMGESNNAGDFLVQLVKSKFVPKSAAAVTSSEVKDISDPSVKTAKEHVPTQSRITEDAEADSKVSEI